MTPAARQTASGGSASLRSCRARGGDQGSRVPARELSAYPRMPSASHFTATSAGSATAAVRQCFNIRTLGANSDLRREHVMRAESLSPTRRSFLAAAAGVGLLLAPSVAAGDARSNLPSGTDASQTGTAKAGEIRPFRVNVPDGRPRRSPPTHRRHALARSRDGQRPVAGHPARKIAGAGSPLGNGLRLAQSRGEAERPAAVRHQHRRPRYPFHPRPLQACQCPAGDHDARLAGLGVRTRQGRRPAHRSDRPRRQGRGRVRPRVSFDARLRLLRQADGHRLGPRPHRANLGAN